MRRSSSGSLSHRTTSVDSGSDGAATTVPRLVAVEVDGRSHEVRLHVTEPPWAELARRRRGRSRLGARRGGNGAVVSPMQGTVLKVEVADGDEVEAGQLLCVIEAMKMENEIVAPRVGIVRDLAVAPGAAVTSGQLICVVATAEPGVTVDELVERLVGDAVAHRRDAEPARGRRSPDGAPHHGRPRHAPLRARSGTSGVTSTRARPTRTSTGPRSRRSSVSRSARTYRQALLHEPDADWQVLAGRGEPRVLRRPPTRPQQAATHDRAKRHLLPEGEPVPFLVALGVQTRGRAGCARRGGRSSGRSTGSSSSSTTSSPALPEGPLCGSWTSAPGART